MRLQLSLDPILLDDMHFLFQKAPVMVPLRFRRRPESPYYTPELSFQRKLEPPKLMKFHFKLSLDNRDFQSTINLTKMAR